MAEENENDKVLKCSNCGSVRIRETQEAELVCQDCGMVIDQDRVSESAGPRAFTAAERERKKRTGSPVTYTEPSRGIRTEIGRGAGSINQVSPKKRSQYYRMRKMHRRLDQSKDRRMKQALSQLESLVDVLGLPESVTEEAARLYEKALEKDVVKGRKIEPVVGSLVYIVSRNQGIPRTMTEISEEIGTDSRELGKTYRYVARELDLRIIPIDPEDFVPRFSSQLGLSGETEALARNIVSDSREKGILAGRSPDSIAASALYLASIIKDQDISQKEISEVVGVTEVTIRKGYQNIIEGLEMEEEVERARKD